MGKKDNDLITDLEVELNFKELLRRIAEKSTRLEEKRKR